MSTTSPRTWTSGWSASDAPEIDYVWLPADTDAWSPGPWPHLESLDLGLAKASSGILGGRRLRAKAGAGGADTGWHCHNSDFEFFYVLRGSLKVETEDGEHYTLGQGAAGCHPALYRHREYDISDDLEYVQLTVPGEPTTLIGEEAAPGSAGGLRPVYTFETPKAYTLGAGPRSFFKYRDLGAAAATEGRIHVHIVRATEPGPGTGWHYHSMAQWFMILGGSSVIRVEEQPKQPLNVFDSMCIGRGPNMRHNVAPYTGDYAVLEMCVPSQYETIAVPPPENADAPPQGARE